MTHTREARVFEMEVAGIEALSATVRRIILRPRSDAMEYREGQFLSVLLPGGDARCYSMAGLRQDDGRIELHARLHPGGKFSTLVTRDLKPGGNLRVAGPFGDCVLKPETASSEVMVALAAGTGVAPLKAIIERMLLDEDDRPISLYWGGRTRDDLYLLDYFTGLQASRRNFRFIPVLAEPDPSWSGRKGFVHDAAVADIPSLSRATVYACGAPAMVDAARRLLIGQHGLSPTSFHADPFETPTPTALPSSSPVKEIIHILAAPATGPQTLVEGRIGATLQEALKSAGLPVHNVCGGKKSCGTCRVRLDPPVASQDRDELRLLASLDATHPGDRLACQVRLHAGLDRLGVRLPASPF